LVRNRDAFLTAVMAELAGNAEISFEGAFGNLRLSELPGASNTERATLKRNTLWPKCDFVILPLELSTIRSIISAYGGTIPRSIVHIQIAKNGKLEFGAYDNFHPHAIAIGEALSDEFIESLAAKKLIEVQ
jgi:hypothetical protein